MPGLKTRLNPVPPKQVQSDDSTTITPDWTVAGGAHEPANSARPPNRPLANSIQIALITYFRPTGAKVWPVPGLRYGPVRALSTLLSLKAFDLIHSTSV